MCVDGPFDTLSPLQLDVLRRLSRAGLRFLVIGGYAVRVHGHRRCTEDLDIVISAESDDAGRLASVLPGLRQQERKSIKEKFHLPEKKVALHLARVDIMSSMIGINVKQALGRAVLVPYKELRVPVMACEDLIRAKELAIKDNAREESRKALDRADLLALQSVGTDG